jgi:hypothetical protein
LNLKQFDFQKKTLKLMQPFSADLRLYGVMSTNSRTYSAHIGSLYMPNFWMATSGLTDSFFNEAVRTGISKSMAVAYRCDAARLYLRSIGNTQPLANAPVFLDENEVFLLYRSLLAVYQSSHRTAQLVTREHRIHTVANPNIDRLAIVFDKDGDFFDNNSRGTICINNPALKAIVEKYNLIVSKYYYYNEDCDGVTLLSQKPLNMAALAQELRKIEGIKHIENVTDDNNVSDIRAVRTPEGWLLEFCLHANDKPIAWLFEVTHSGRVICKDDGYIPHARSAKGYSFSQTRSNSNS